MINKDEKFKYHAITFLSICLYGMNHSYYAHFYILINQFEQDWLNCMKYFRVTQIPGDVIYRKFHLYAVIVELIN